MSNSAPVFPLRTVLFPGGRLPLQIFEPRYIDMVRDCSKEGTPFAVCLLLEGGDNPGERTLSAFGCLAGIVDFYTLDNGLLGITALGSRRIRLTATRVRDDGLILADYERLPEPPGGEPGPEHAVLVTLLRSLLEQALDQAAEESGEGAASIDERALRDSAWVSYRLAELLPLDLEQRQQMLEIGDPRERLNLLNEMVSALRLGDDS